MFSNKWFLLAVIVVAVLVAWSLSDFKGEEKMMETPGASSEEEESQGSEESQGGAAPSAPRGGGSSFTQTQIQNYSQLVNQYEGKRIQFDERCQVFPADVTFKNGTSIMLDNRSPQTKTVKIGDRTYDLPAYGYRLTTLSSATLPNSLTIGCNNAADVGRILLQANILEQF